MAELIIGDHCCVPSCKQLDFLPCVCNGCGLTFCKVHMCYAAHDCPRNDIVSSATEVTTGPIHFVCSLPSCGKRQLTEVRCDKCGQNFCLAHRLEIDHECKNMEVRPVRMERTAQCVQNILSKSQETTASAAKKPLMSDKSRATAARVALMKLKQTATGDRGIPDVDRVYFHVVLPSVNDQSPPCSSSMFFNKTWSIGRVIDSIASAKHLTNSNNIAGAKKLRLFDVYSNASFPSDRTIESLIKTETGENASQTKQHANDEGISDSTQEVTTWTLHNGSKVILEYVDDNRT